jgi:MerR family transcriptional regulator, light-induced transcriptional regulator
MNHFTIKDIEHLTGIKSHTLRIWEQRYGIPNPKRTSTNIRYYDDEDLKLLLNVSMLNRQGHKISRLTSLTKEELEKLVYEVSKDVTDTDSQIDSLLAAMFNLDETAFERLLSSNLIKNGLEDTLLNLFFPFMKRIGLLWQAGHVSPAFEHFMSNLIRQKIIVAIDSQVSVKTAESKKFILFLPESETHELGLLFANYIIRAHGHHSIYLGQNLPYTDLDAIIGQYKCDYILTVLTSTPSRITVQNFVNNLGNRYKHVNILVTGIQVTSIPGMATPSNVKIINEFGDLSVLLEKMS